MVKIIIIFIYGAIKKNRCGPCGSFHNNFIKNFSPLLGKFTVFIKMFYDFLGKRQSQGVGINKLKIVKTKLNVIFFLQIYIFSVNLNK